MKIGKRVIAICMAVIMIALSVPIVSLGANAVATGKAGESITWTLYDDGTMIFDGKGVMYDFDGPFASIAANAEEENNISIKSLKINSGITYIGESVINSLKKLETVVIPDTVERIGEGAFAGCESLKEIRLPNSLTAIEKSTFSGCTALTHIEIPDGVEYIAEEAFDECTALSSVTISKSVREIGENAFYKCTNLSSVSFAEGLETIGTGAFYQCEKLRSVQIPKTVKRIKKSAFSACFVLSSINIPGDDVSIGQDAFADTQYYDFEDNWENGMLYIGKHLIKVKNTRSYSYQIKEGTKTIADYAFQTGTELDNFNRISEIDVPDSVVRIGSGAFSKCNYLRTIQISDSTKYIASDALGIGNYRWYDDQPNGCIYVGKVLIGYKTGFNETMPENTSIKVKEGTIGISDNAFSRQENLTSIDLPDSLEYIGAYAFEQTGLTSITIPNNVKSIGDQAFSYTKIEKVTFPDSVVEIGSSVFCGWSPEDNYLKRVTIGSNVKRIGLDPFGSDKLERISVNGNNPYYCSDETGCLYSKDKTILYRYPCGSSASYYVVPDGVKEIKTNAFAYTNSLDAIWLPTSIRLIEYHAFHKIGKSGYPKSGTYYVYYPGAKSDFYTNVYATSAFYFCDAPLYASQTFADFLSRWNDTEEPDDTQPSTDPVTQPSTDPVTQPPTDPVTQPSTDPVTQPSTDPVTQPSTDPVTNPSQEPTGEEPAQPDSDHVHDRTVVKNPATFDEDGDEEIYCEECGYTYSYRTIPAIASVKLSTSKYAYDGKQKKPKVVVRDKEGNKLEEGKDYTVKYSSGRKKVGKYNVRVTFQGNYEGTKKLSFKIVPGKVSGLKATAGKKFAQLKWKAVKGATNYVVYFATKKNGTFKKAFTTRGATAKVMKLKTGRTYYFRVRAIAKLDSGTFNGNLSAIKKVKIK